MITTLAIIGGLAAAVVGGLVAWLVIAWRRQESSPEYKSDRGE